MAAAGPAATATAAATPSFSDLLLVGEVGRRWVATQRERGEEGEAAIGRSVRLRSQPVHHVLELLALMGESREQMTAELVTELKRAMLPMIPSLAPDRLLALLAETFAYLPVEELRPVPIAVLEALARHDEIPQVYLLRLATRPDLIAVLPLPLQRLAWAKDANPLAWATVAEADRPAGGGGGSFQAELARLLAAYVHSDALASATRQLGPPPMTKAAQQPPQSRRAAHLELGKLADAIEGSPELYGAAVAAIESGWREACEGDGGPSSGSPAAWCALRGELVLLVADRKQLSVAKTDPVFQLALSLDTASRDGEVKKGPREVELKQLLPWAVGGAAQRHSAAMTSDAERMVLGSPYALPMLIRSALNRLRDAVDSPTSAAAVAAALADPGIDDSTRFFSALTSAALDSAEDKTAGSDLLSGLGALGLLVLHDSTGIARRGKRQKLQKEKYAKARQVGASVPPATLPDLPDLGTEKSIASSLSAERLRGAESWRRVLLFYILQRVDRRDPNPSPPGDGLLLRGALLAADGLQLPPEVEGQWCTALVARCTAMHRRGTLPQPVRTAIFNGFFCDAVRRQLPPHAHAAYARLLGTLMAPPTAAAAAAAAGAEQEEGQGGAIKAQEALPLVGTALAAAEARGWFATPAAGRETEPGSAQGRPAKRARPDTSASGTSGTSGGGGTSGTSGGGGGGGSSGGDSSEPAQKVVAAYEGMKRTLEGLGPAFMPVVGMVGAKLQVEEEEERDPFFG
jgi:uncharacterized membrane protein YgcG